MARRPQVVAHRGASADEAEHTLAAYAKALDDGADGLECDVRLTRDGVLVCVHDRRVDRTSSGRGVVSTLELADLSELDFGSWRQGTDGDAPDRDTDRPDRDTDGPATASEAPADDRTSVLTLSRLLDMVAAAGRPVELAIETKHPTRYAGLVESTLVELLDLHGLTGRGVDGPVRARVMSFAPSGLRRVRVLAPDLPTVQLMRRVPLRHRDGTVSAGVDIAGPSLPALRAFPAYVERAKARGHQVHAWTVDEPADVEFVAELGVDVIITNRPAAVLAQLGDHD